MLFNCTTNVSVKKNIVNLQTSASATLRNMLPSHDFWPSFPACNVASRYLGEAVSYVERRQGRALLARGPGELGVARGLGKGLEY